MTLCNSLFILLAGNSFALSDSNLGKVLKHMFKVKCCKGKHVLSALMNRDELTHGLLNWGLYAAKLWYIRRMHETCMQTYCTA